MELYELNDVLKFKGNVSNSAVMASTSVFLCRQMVVFIAGFHAYIAVTCYSYVIIHSRDDTYSGQVCH